MHSPNELKLLVLECHKIFLPEFVRVQKAPIQVTSAQLLLVALHGAANNKQELGSRHAAIIAYVLEFLVLANEYIANGLQALRDIFICPFALPHVVQCLE